MAVDQIQDRFDCVTETPWSGIKLGLGFSNNLLTSVDFLSADVETCQLSTASQQLVIHQLDCYFSNPNHQFEIPLELKGTAFQVRVWNALRLIPAGETISYGELADRLASSARAVGNACRANRLPLVVPCHRVVAKSGLGGFMGQRQGGEISIKRCLLLHERAIDGG